MSAWSERLYAPELMDREDADVGRLRRTVRQFGLINRLFSRSLDILNRHVIVPNLGRPVTIADVGAGGGDIMIRMARACRRVGLPLKAVCIDRDARILGDTARRCRPYPEIEVRQWDVRELRDLGPFDYVFCNNLLHHFADPEIPGILRTMYDAARRGLVVSDIRRSPSAYVAYSLFAGAFLHRSFAGYDGRLSIRKGFLEEELRAHAAEAGIGDGAQIKTLTPARLVLFAEKRGHSPSPHTEPGRGSPKELSS
jgi:2-polyprenyl-3-methyl-5-hydroxy-6-metoxy-1,4-benzoquinol methylase